MSSSVYRMPEFPISVVQKPYVAPVVRTPTPSAPKQQVAVPQHILQARHNELVQRVNNLALRMPVPGKADATLGQLMRVGVTTGALDTTVCQKANDRVYIPYSLLLKYEDLPEQFQLNGPNDPRLKDEAFLKNFSDWLNIVGKQLNFKPSTDLKLAKIVLTALSNPYSNEIQKEFMLAHALTHLNPENQSRFLKTPLETIMVFLAAVGIALIFIGICSIPTVGPVIALLIVLAGIASITAGLLIFRAGVTKCLEIEERCDKQAARLIGDAQGGIDLFREELQRNREHLRANPKDDHYDEKGNYLDPHQPGCADRLDYLQNLQFELAKERWEKSSEWERQWAMQNWQAQQYWQQQMGQRTS